MILISPLQFWQCSRSISNTRLSSLAQLNRTSRWYTQFASHSASWAAASGPCGTTQRAQFGVGRQHSMKADQVQHGARHQRGQALHERPRRHHQVRGVVAPGGLELEHHLACGVGLHPFVGQCRAGDVAAQLFQRLALVGAAAHGGVQAETLNVGAHILLGVRIPGHEALQCQHLLSGSRAEGDAIIAGYRLQRPEHAGLVRITVGVGQECLALLFDRHPPHG